jgi:predicted GTPase
VINKVDSATCQQIETVRKNIERHAPNAEIVLAESAIRVDEPGKIKGQRVLVIEDGPTMTHGGMSYGAGVIAAKKYDATEIVDPKQYASGTIKDTYHRYPNIGAVLPAMGYSKTQIHDLELTLNHVDCDLVLCATPVDLQKFLSINKPIVRVEYEYKNHGNPLLEDVLMKCLQKLNKN